MNDSDQSAHSSAEPDQLNFSTATEADLFEWMAAAESCQEDARAAFAEFHRRHAAFLYAQCVRRYRGAAEDIVQDTLLRVYERAETFDLERAGGGVTPAGASRAVRAWMGSIAHQIATDYLADRTSGPLIVTPERITSLPDNTCADPAREYPSLDAELIERVRQVIDELSPREQEIAWVIAHRWSPDYQQNCWATEDLDSIAEKFSLKRENLRQIRTRLIKKLRTLLTPVTAGNGSAW